MVYTVTLNPSIDYLMWLSKNSPDGIHRSDRELLSVGGKGINVSLVLKELGIPSVAFSFCAGFTGEWMEEQLELAGILTDFVQCEQGYTRINVKGKGETEWEVNAAGFTISKRKQDEFLERLDKIRDGDVLVLSGSIPPGMSPDVYERILNRLRKRKILFVADFTGDALRSVLQYHPFLVKPNHLELGALFGANIETTEDAIFYAKKVKEMGAANVLVSMAHKGAVFLGEKDEVLFSPACKGLVKNSVGAGDSMVAGFLYGYLTRGSSVEALKYGTAAGAATAFSEGLASKETIEALYQQLI